MFQYRTSQQQLSLLKQIEKKRQKRVQVAEGEILASPKRLETLRTEESQVSYSNKKAKKVESKKRVKF